MAKTAIFGFRHTFFLENNGGSGISRMKPAPTRHATSARTRAMSTWGKFSLDLDTTRDRTYSADSR
jgi:hypothetical protein